MKHWSNKVTVYVCKNHKTYKVSTSVYVDDIIVQLKRTTFCFHCFHSDKKCITIAIYFFLHLFKKKNQLSNIYLNMFMQLYKHIQDRYTIFTTFWLCKHFQLITARCSEIHIQVQVISPTPLQCEIVFIIYERICCLEYLLQQYKKIIMIKITALSSNVSVDNKFCFKCYLYYIIFLTHPIQKAK